MADGDLTLRAKSLSNEAIDKFTTDLTKGKLKGRLVVVGEGKDAHISYKKTWNLLSRITGVSEEKTDKEQVLKFCKEHALTSGLVSTISQRIASPVQLSKREQQAADALRDNPSQLTNFSKKELEKAVKSLDVQELYNILKATTPDKMPADAYQALNSREEQEALQALRESNKLRFGNDQTKWIGDHIMQSKDSPRTMMGGDALIQWAKDNDKQVLLEALLRRLPKGEQGQHSYELNL